MSDLATANFALLLGMCVVTAAAGVFMWLRVHAPGARVLALLLLACALNSGAFALEFVTVSLTTKVIVEKILIVSAATIPALWFVFALQFTGRRRSVTRTVIVLVAVLPLISFLLAVSNEAHHLFWRDVSLAPADAYLAAQLVFGPAYWAHIVYSNALLAAGTVLLLQLFWRSWSQYRGQAIALLVAVSIPWLAQSMYLGGLSPVHGIDLVSVSLCVAALLLAVGFGRLRAADVISVSRAAILDSLVDAVMVLDSNARVLYSNPVGMAFQEHVSRGAVPTTLAHLLPQALDERSGETGRLMESSRVSWRDDDASIFDLVLSPVVDASGRALAKVLVARDVSEQRQAEEHLAAAAREWRETFDAMSDSVALLDEEGRVLRCNAATTALTGRSYEDIVGRPCYQVFHGAATYIPDCSQRRAHVSGQTETSIVAEDGRWLRDTFQPLVDEGGRLSGGVHMVTDVSELKRAEQGLLKSLTVQETVTEGVIAALARTVEVRDPYTAGHQRRVSELAAAMARSMGLGEERAEGVRVAGMLHDVGKITVPAEMLSKPGRLTAIEFELIKGHAQAGYEILRTIHFPWQVAEMALQHHERQDGSGYPQGLKGEEVLPEARVLAVADVVEAMASHRPYRAALGIAAALDEVRSGAGTRYDASVVAACEGVFAEGFGFTET